MWKMSTFVRFSGVKAHINRKTTQRFETATRLLPIHLSSWQSVSVPCRMVNVINSTLQAQVWLRVENDKYIAGDSYFVFFDCCCRLLVLLRTLRRKRWTVCPNVAYSFWSNANNDTKNSAKSENRIILCTKIWLESFQH